MNSFYYKIIYLVIFLSMGCASGKDIIAPSQTSKPDILKKGPLTNSLGMEFAYIAPGVFWMGSPENEPGRCGDEDLHRVTLTNGFYIQTTEVTVGQWRAFVRDSGYNTEAELSGGAYTLTGIRWERKEGLFWDNPGFSQSEQHPVTCVSWNDVQAFAEWLNRKENAVYRLPTESEWEYACRAGTETPFSFGKCLSADQANYDVEYPLMGCPENGQNNRNRTIPVASFAPNAWGLYDMHGNIWEWCQDWWGHYPSGFLTDPKGASSGIGRYPSRVSRGGGWFVGAWRCRSAFRRICWPASSDNTLGFRLVRESDSSVQFSKK